MNIVEFIKYADKVSNKLITEMSTEDKSLVKEILEKYRNPGYFVNDIYKTVGTSGGKSALLLYSTLFTGNYREFTTDDILLINGYIILFVSDDERLKGNLMTYLRSFNRFDIDAILNRHFSNV